MSRMTKTTKLGLTAIAVALLFVGGAAAGGHGSAIVATDDWPPDSAFSLGELNCPGGEIVIDPFTGLPICSPGSRTHIRDALYYSCVQGFTADGAPEPRFTGVMSGSMNVNWDAAYTGSVWGTWLLVPSETCDPAVLDDPETYWIGRWRGQRTAACDDGGACVWVGNLKFGGHGRGDLRGLHFKGTELILTYTPLPLPYELLAAFGVCQPGSCPTGPEGYFTGTIQ